MSGKPEKQNRTEDKIPKNIFLVFTQNCTNKKVTIQTDLYRLLSSMFRGFQDVGDHVDCVH